MSELWFHRSYIIQSHYVMISFDFIWFAITTPYLCLAHDYVNICRHLKSLIQTTCLFKMQLCSILHKLFELTAEIPGVALRNQVNSLFTARPPPTVGRWLSSPHNKIIHIIILWRWKRQATSNWINLAQKYSGRNRCRACYCLDCFEVCIGAANKYKNLQISCFRLRDRFLEALKHN